MKLENLLQGLNAPPPEIRLNVVQVLGMVDETRATPQLRERFAVETDPEVKNAIQWAGRKIHQAAQAGYSTINEIFRFFFIDREIENLVDPREAELVRRITTNMENDLLKSQLDSANRKVGTAAAIGIGGTLLAGPLVGGAMFTGAMSVGSELASSNVGALREQLSTQRTPAPRPSDVNIGVWVKRLREDPNPENRKSVAIELANFNNPAALPFLAAAYINDPEAAVRDTAHTYGKILYWKAIYWEMELDGSLQEEFKKRAKAAGKDFAPLENAGATGSGELALSKSEPPPLPAANKDDIAQILARAEAEKAKRKKR
jgi:hypothetical protein